MKSRAVTRLEIQWPVFVVGIVLMGLSKAGFRLGLGIEGEVYSLDLWSARASDSIGAQLFIYSWKKNRWVGGFRP